MSTTLKAIRRDMLARVPGAALGRLESIASLTTTTCVVTALATGSRSADDFIGKWLLRAEPTTTADRVRRVSAFTTASGTLTHAGANYSDTTATSEFVEILTHEPRWYDDAIQATLARLRRQDREIIPTVQGQRRYFLHDFTWIEGPGDIERVCWSSNPVINRDRYFEKWNTVNSSGTLQPDWWTLAGASATVERSTTQTRRRQYSAKITRSGTDCTLTQTLNLLDNGTASTNNETLRGQTLTIACVAWSAVASQLRMQVLDGTQTVSTSYHTGGSAWEELSTTITVSASATSLSIRISVVSDNTACYVQEAYVAERSGNDDAIRRDAYADHEIDYDFQNSPQPSIVISPRGRGGQLVIYSRRPYPQFDSTRLTGGSADADSTDAPQDIVATMAIGRLFEGLARQPGEDTTRYAYMAEEWKKRGERLAMQHLAVPTHPKGGAALPAQQFGFVPATLR